MESREGGRHGSPGTATNAKSVQFHRDHIQKDRSKFGTGSTAPIGYHFVVLLHLPPQTWFTRQFVFLLIAGLNILLAYVFYNLLAMLPVDETARKY